METEKTRKCPKCQSDISVKATKCPFCQSKVSRPMSKLLLALLGISVILMIIVSVSSDSTPSSVTYDDPRGWASIYPELLVERVLKAPSTADFCRAEVTDLGNNQYRVVSCVDSQNSFGAMLRSNWSANVTLIGADPSQSENWEINRVVFDGEVIYGQ